MLAEYAAYAERVGVLEMPEGYDSMKQVTRNVGARLLTNYPWLYGVLGVALLGLVVVAWLALRGMRGLLRRRTAQ
jgi:arylsulfatase/uncharacterized sulfatase